MAKNIMLDSLDIDMGVDLEPEYNGLSAITDTEMRLKSNSTQDYNDARDNIKDLIKTGSDVIPELASLAADSESARVYEVLSTSLKTLADMNKTLLELTKQQQDIVATEKTPDNITNNNNVYVQSTEDLLRMIKDGNTPKTE